MRKKQKVTKHEMSKLSQLVLKECTVPEKNPYPLHGRSLEIPRRRGVLQVKILEAMYEAKLEFPEGSGVQNKKTCWGGGGSMDISETTQN